MSKYNKILGSIMGAAVGDAMGAATETRSAERIKEDFGGYVDKIITPPSDCFARGYDGFIPACSMKLRMMSRLLSVNTPSA